MKKIFFLFLISASGAAFAADSATIAVHGHRGSRGTVPENTIPAFEAALMAGADVIELDMGVTKDGVVVVSHEPKVTPELCLGPDGEKLNEALPLQQLTLAEVKKYDCGSLVNPRFPQQLPVPGTPMPTLEEVFSYVKTSGYENAATVEFNIETKIFPSQPELAPSPAEFAKLVVAAVKKHGLEKRVIVQSFDVRTLREVKKLAPAIRTSQLTYESLVDIVAAIKGAKADIWSPNHKWITREAVDEAHEAGIQVAPWTLNRRSEWDAAIAAGVDAIITDYPDALVEHLKSKKLR